MILRNNKPIENIQNKCKPCVYKKLLLTVRLYFHIILNRYMICMKHT